MELERRCCTVFLPHPPLSRAFSTPARKPKVKATSGATKGNAKEVDPLRNAAWYAAGGHIKTYEHTLALLISGYKGRDVVQRDLSMRPPDSARIHPS